MNSTDSLKALGIDTLPEIEKLTLGKYADRAGKLGHLAQALATLDMAKAQQGVAAVRKAQDDAAIRALGGQAHSAGEEMQQIVFGDLNHHAAQPRPSGLSTLAKLGIGAALISSGVGAGLGGALLLDALRRPAAVAPVTPQPGTSTTIERDYEVGPVKIEPPSLFDLQEP